ncbi:hypothetical protein [Sideroxydans lithotrophicus]|uniref:Uncharacterized protein n=1 Tax=Sideroxydans lithotrophicus (strain ES-1) TaxID=580332 RepID=D5CPY9_SIDLE|nr:hypothetical protein [Sideroxydans lithotrophicus]ADE11153.1 conserved hypothetical protein [Sideroxydans lithotrophicus ES-1]
MSERSGSPFAVNSMQHRAFGKLVKLQFADDFTLRLTQAEASSLSFALVAVRDGISPEREIYMSPIASDAAFVGSVCDSGMSIAVPAGALELDWFNVGRLAELLAAAID